MLTIDSLHQVKICAVDPAGHKLGKRRVEIKLFKMDWSWWWERDYGTASFLQNESKNRVQWDTVTLVGGQGTWGLKVKYPNYGRYVLRACDLDAGDAGHCTGETFYMDWPYWYGRAERDGKAGGATILTFKSDKTKYNVGEKMRITIPSPKGGRALISMEKGAGVFKRYWVDLKPNETVHEILVEPGMAPNIYLYVALLQPHSQTENDLPIRMYNVIPISVEDPDTRLHPAVKTDPGVFRPGEQATLTVSETNGKAMNYVVAVVDEGLLDLTRFKTPDPWERFYSREALGIKTWDLYDFVAGAYGDRLERILSIGGDEGGTKNPTGRKGNRFPPMVKFLGPFTLAKGKQAKHTLAIPEYVGAVRVMVVAAREGAYGFAEQSVFVRKPLMVLATLPRILSPGETFELPISVFAMEKQVKSVEVEVTSTGPIKIMGESKKTLNIDAPSDELINFKMESLEAVGWSKLTIRAKSGGEKAEQTIEVQVRNPNTKVTNMLAALVQPNTKWSQSFSLVGVGGTNKATLELSRMPPFDLEKRLSYLIQYPHGCIEQTTSSVFPQLYLSDLMDLPDATKQEIEVNVKAAIHRLLSFQTPSGGFSYWPGDPNPNDWGSSYAGHFIIEAEKKGYSLPAGMLDQWKRYQRNLAQSWTARFDYYSPLSQSYRLYTLALAGSPEMGPMNRLKESKHLEVAARWQLGAAYQLAGQHEVALALTQGSPTVKTYTELNGNFGSDLRDKAMMLEVLCLMDKKTEAAPLMLEVAKSLANDDWWSTQTTAYSLIAMAKFAGKIFDRKGSIGWAFNGNGVNQTGTLTAPMLQKEIKILEGQGQANQVDVQNKGPGLLYARLLVVGIPKLGDETAVSQGITLTMEYLDMQGKPIGLTKFDQGQDFIAEFKVHHNSGRGRYEQLALTSAFPSGFEIRNTRMDVIADPKGGKTAAWFTYQDIRDDRVLTYFDLNTGEEKVFRFYLNAAYLGKFHQPQSKVEAMYDATISARTGGRIVEVLAGTDKPGNPNLPSALGEKKVPKNKDNPNEEE
jgi:alpha-2-macroglobulin